MNWKVAYEKHHICKNKTFQTIAQIEADGMPIIPATVPGYHTNEFHVSVV